MAPKGDKPREINISAKLLLRVFSLLMFVLTPVLFFYSTLSFRTVGVVFAAAVVSLVLAEFAEH